MKRTIDTLDARATSQRHRVPLTVARVLARRPEWSTFPRVVRLVDEARKIQRCRRTKAERRDAHAAFERSLVGRRPAHVEQERRRRLNRQVDELTTTVWRIGDLAREIDQAIDEEIGRSRFGVGGVR